MTHRPTLLTVLVLALVATGHPPANAQEPSTTPRSVCRAPAVARAGTGLGPKRTDVGQRTVGLATSHEDTSDVGEGAFRLCLDGQPARSGRATCRWTEDRSAVTSVRTRDLRLDDRRASVDLVAATDLWHDELDSARLTISIGRPWWSTEDPGSLAIDRPAPDELRARFHAERVGAPDTRHFDGSLAVRCGAPPPLDMPSRTLGTLTVDAAGEHGGPWTASAVCDWATWDRATRVVGVQLGSERIVTGPDRSIRVSLSLDSVPSVTAWLGRSDLSDEDTEWLLDTRHAFPIWTRLDRSRGTVRAHGLVPSDLADEEEPLPPGTPTLDMWASWECGEPPQARLPVIDWEASRGRPGLVTIRMPGLTDSPIVAAASCIASEDDDPDGGGPWTEVESVAASFQLDERPALLIAERTGFVALYLADADGAYRGDLVRSTPEPHDDWTGDDRGHADLPLQVLRRSPVTRDPDIPQVLPIAVTWDCQPGLGPLG